MKIVPVTSGLALSLMMLPGSRASVLQAPDGLEVGSHTTITDRPRLTAGLSDKAELFLTGKYGSLGIEQFGLSFQRINPFFSAYSGIDGYDNPNHGSSMFRAGVFFSSGIDQIDARGIGLKSTWDESASYQFLSNITHEGRGGCSASTQIITAIPVGFLILWGPLQRTAGKIPLPQRLPG